MLVKAKHKVPNEAKRNKGGEAGEKEGTEGKEKTPLVGELFAVEAWKALVPLRKNEECPDGDRTRVHRLSGRRLYQLS